MLVLSYTASAYATSATVCTELLPCNSQRLGRPGPLTLKERAASRRNVVLVMSSGCSTLIGQLPKRA